MTPDTVEEEEMFDSRLHNPAKLQEKKVNLTEMYRAL